MSFITDALDLLDDTGSYIFKGSGVFFFEIESH